MSIDPHTDLEQRLNRLGESLRAGPSLVPHVTRRIERDRGWPPERSIPVSYRWIGMASGAVCVIVAVALLWLAWVDSDQDASIAAIPVQAVEADIGTVRLAYRHAIAIGDRAVLVCWTVYDHSGSSPTGPTLPDAHPAALPTPAPSSSGRSTYRHVLVRSDPTPQGFAWHWSLLISERRVARSDPPVLPVSGFGFDRLGIGITPYAPADSQVEPLLEAVQRSTLPRGASSERLLTLAEIERLLAASAQPLTPSD